MVGQGLIKPLMEFCVKSCGLLPHRQRALDTYRVDSLLPITPTRTSRQHTSFLPDSRFHQCSTSCHFSFFIKIKGVPNYWAVVRPPLLGHRLVGELSNHPISYLSQLFFLLKFAVMIWTVHFRPK